MIQPTPYDQKVQALKQRLNKRPGPNPNLKDRLQAARQKQRGYQAPPYYSGAYESAVGGLNQNLGMAQADIAGQRLGLEQQYGFGADQSNPYSIARSLERQRGQQFAATTASKAASGQTFSGSVNRARREDEYQHGEALDRALREYQAKLGGLSRDELGASADYTQGLAEAEAGRLQSAIEDRADPTEARRKAQKIKDRLKKKGK